MKSNQVNDNENTVSENVLEFKTLFKITSNSESLPFEYERTKDGMYYTTASDLLVDMAEDAELIEVIKRNVPFRQELFVGKPEPILNGNLKLVHPNNDGSELIEEKFGGYKCVRCGHITYIYQTDSKVSKPYECDGCNRKGPFKPMFPQELLKPIWRPPFSALECSPVGVYEDIYEYIKQYLVIQEEEYHLMTLWIMASYLVEDFKTVPYLLFIAPKESGKSQAMGIINLLGYRAFLAASVTPSSLFRAIELWKITLLIDEAETQISTETESGQALYQTLNMGYKRGSYAIRVEGDARIPTRFDVFGFKAIASTKIFLPTLESRSIIINMSQGKPEKIIFDEDRSDVIRSELVYFRFRYLNKMDIVQPQSNSGRIIEIMTPLFTVAEIFKGLSGVKTAVSYDALQKILDNKIKDLENIRHDEEHSSIEAMVIEEIDRLRKAQSSDITLISIKSISMGLKWINEYSEPQKVKESSAKLGRILKVMGIPTHRTGDGFVIEHMKQETKDRIDKAVKRYLAKRGGEKVISQHDKINLIRTVITQIQTENKKNIAPLKKIISTLKENNIDADTALNIITELKTTGHIIEVSDKNYRFV